MELPVTRYQYLADLFRPRYPFLSTAGLVMHQQRGKGAARRGTQWSWAEPTGGGLGVSKRDDFPPHFTTKMDKMDHKNISTGIFWEFSIVDQQTLGLDEEKRELYQQRSEIQTNKDWDAKQC